MRGAIVATIATLAFGCAEGSPDNPGDGEGGKGGDGVGQGGSGGETSVCGPVVDGPRCMESGWCWDAPRPQAVQFEDVDGAPDGSSIFAVGSLGGVFRRCQGAWVPIESETDADLYGVWHPAADLAIAVGESGTILRWDGESWSKLPSPVKSTLRAVWGSAPEDVWIGGVADEQGAVLLHYDGKSLTRLAGEVTGYAYDIVSIDGRSNTDVFAVGGSWEYDVSLRYDGFNWTMLPGGHGYPDFGPFKSVIALDGGTTVANFDGYNTSRLFRLDGYDWTEVHYGGYSGALHALFQDGGDAAEVVQSSPGGGAPYELLRLEGDQWNPTGETMPALPHTVWALPLANDAWAVGASSVLMGHVPGVWSQVPELTTFPSGPQFIEGSADEDLWVVTQNQAAHRDAQGWTVEQLPTEWASGASVDVEGRLWIVSENAELKYREGTEWKTLPSAADSIYSMVANGPDDVWVTTTSGTMHFYANVWEVFGGCPALHDPSVVWTAGGSRLRRAPDGKVWLASSLGAFVFDGPHTCKLLMGSGGTGFESDPLADVAWTGDGTLWAISHKGNLYRRDGNYLVFRGDMLGADASDGATIKQLFGTSSGKLRLVYDDVIETSTEYIYKTFITTFDGSAGTKVGSPIETPSTGMVWIPDDQHAVVAIDGGVLRYGYEN